VNRAEEPIDGGSPALGVVASTNPALKSHVMGRLDIPEGDGGDAVQVWSLRPEMGAAVNRLVNAAYNQSILAPRVREAARMRIAQLNDCTVCLAFRADSVKAQGVSEEFYSHVGSHDDGGDFTGQERLAMEYAERFALDHLSIDDAFFDRLRQSFTDPEILDLTICLSAFLGLGRTLRVLGITETSLTDVGRR
jgi:alkylhydroperoxidase family enzyme